MSVARAGQNRDSKKGIKPLTLLAATCLFVLASAEQSSASCETGPALSALLKSPDNIETVIRHAQCAVDAGNYESAIATYEALLIYAPDNPEIELELATLYAKAGASELAKAHYENVAALDSASDEQRESARNGVAALSSALDENFQFSHYVAWRYQDNANLGISSAIISAGTTRITVPSNQQERSDAAIWHEGGLSYRFGGGQSINDWELNLDWFGNWQDEATSLNSLLIAAELGPEFDLSRIAGGVTFRPYATLTHSILEEEPLYNAFGGGGVLAHDVSDRLSWEAKFDYRTYSYDDNALRSLSTTYDGTQLSARGELTYAVADNLQLTGSAMVSRADLKDDEYSYDGYQLQAGAIWDSGLQLFDAGSVVLDVEASFETRDYWDPSTTFPILTRSDEQFSVLAEIDIPLTSALSFVPRVEYDRSFSNDPFSEYEALSIYVGVRVGL